MNCNVNDVKTSLLASLDHSRDAFLSIQPLTGPTQPLTSPDLHKVAEGLLLSSWSRGEQALRLLLIHDLGTRAQGVLRKDVKDFWYAHSDRLGMASLVRSSQKKTHTSRPMELVLLLECVKGVRALDEAIRDASSLCVVEAAANALVTRCSP